MMENLLNPHFSEQDLRQQAVLSLAYIGDGVFGLMARCYLMSQGNYKPAALHKKTTELVCAQAQARAARFLYGRLGEEEAAVFRRGRNAKPKIIPKHASGEEYALATALETLFGWLFLRGDELRLQALFLDVLSMPGKEEGLE